MNTIALLNRYRSSVLADDTKFSLLSILLRDGEQFEEALTERLGIPIRIVRSSLTGLFQDGLVRRTAGGCFELSSSGAEIMSRLGIAPVAGIDFIRNTNLDVHDKEFLGGAIEATGELNHRVSLDQIFYLRTVSRLEQSLRKIIGPEAGQRTHYALLVGLNPDVQRIGCEAFFEVVQRHLVLKMASHRDSTSIQAHRDRLLVHCHRAMDDIRSSDHFFQFDAVPDTPSGRDAVLATSWTRVMAVYLDDHVDDGMRLAARYNREFAPQMWRALNAWRPDIGDISMSIIVEYKPSVARSMVGTDALTQLSSYLSSLFRRTAYIPDLNVPPGPSHQIKAAVKAVGANGDDSDQESGASYRPGMGLRGGVVQRLRNLLYRILRLVGVTQRGGT